MAGFFQSFSVENLIIMMVFLALVYICLFFFSGRSKKTKDRIQLFKKIVIVLEVVILIIAIVNIILSFTTPAA